MLNEVSFLDHQFLVANPFHQLAHVLNNSFVDNHFHLYGVSTSYLPAGYPYILVLQVVGLALLMNVS